MSTKAPRGSGRIKKCSHCGSVVTNSGRDGSDGTRFCMKPDCRAEKARRKRAEERRDDTLEARPCSYCGRQLPSRRKRITDLPFGRWCPDSPCQRAKSIAMETEAYRREAEAQVHRGHLQKAFRALLQGPRVTCGACGRTDVIEGWAHPNRSITAACTGKVDGGHPQHPAVPPVDDPSEIWSVQ